jgi:dihydropteroate synthase
MGIINITPDSFFGDGVLGSEKSLQERFLKARDVGIELLDIGCMSTKPNFKNIDKLDELNRFEFFLNNINSQFKYSIDSNTIEVIDKAIDSGFSVINDVFGFQNQEILKKAIDSHCGVILVHRHPLSENIHEKMEYKDIVTEVESHIYEQISRLIDSGLQESQIAIDPGLGFGKKLEDSARLLLEIESLVGDFPLIVGYSNKKFIDSVSLSKENLLDHCYQSGVSLVRLHIDK